MLEKSQKKVMSMIVQCPTLSCFMWWYFRRVFLAQKHWLSLSSFPQEFQQKIFVTACRLDYYCSSLSLFGSPHASDLFGEEVTVWCARFLLPSTRLLVLWPRPTFRLLHSLVLLAQASPLTPQNDVEVMWAKTATTTKLCTLKATTDGFCTSWNFFYARARYYYCAAEEKSKIFWWWSSITSNMLPDSCHMCWKRKWSIFHVIFDYWIYVGKALNKWTVDIKLHLLYWAIYDTIF